MKSKRFGPPPNGFSTWSEVGQYLDKLVDIAEALSFPGFEISVELIQGKEPIFHIQKLVKASNV